MAFIHTSTSCETRSGVVGLGCNPRIECTASWLPRKANSNESETAMPVQNRRDRCRTKGMPPNTAESVFHDARGEIKYLWTHGSMSADSSGAFQFSVAGCVIHGNLRVHARTFDASVLSSLNEKVWFINREFLRSSFTGRFSAPPFRSRSPLCVDLAVL